MILRSHFIKLFVFISLFMAQNVMANDSKKITEGQAKEGQAKAGEIKIGQLAPDFSLIDQNQKSKTLSDMRGKWVVLYFYPKDETPGCTAEACSFRDNLVAIQASNTVVWGVSVDSTESHAEFAEKHKLPFVLLADTGGKVAKQYGSLLNMFIVKVAKRHSFIIDPQGKIAKIYRQVHPKQHVEEVIKDLKLLQ